MHDYDPRLSFVQYLYHPLMRRFLQWAHGQAEECLEGSGREWGGLVAELELLLRGDHQGPDPVEEILPEGIDGYEEFYPNRLIDQIIVNSELWIFYHQEMDGAESAHDRLVWTIEYLDETLATQERILANFEANLLQYPSPDLAVIDAVTPGGWLSAMSNRRSFYSPEFSEELSEYEIESIKLYSQVMPPFERLGDHSLTKGVFKWLIQRAESALAGGRRWEGTLREFRNLEGIIWDGELPELLENEEYETSDLQQLKFFYTNALWDIDETVRMIMNKAPLRDVGTNLKNYLEVDITSAPAIAAWYLEADLKYLEALEARTPQLVA